ncbi:hypothetical protein BRARA_B02293 [Brassica rapa]|uniref:BnaA02g18630D protein n=3 Tax=Brassica TaxID=3705 RepID=A0A078GQ96_BRANA|nr:uncharacterized protein LOC125605969 [Brassica napus]KAH0840851.1 hypothetical protein HID58_092270 [Brassica napus]RID75237.1 hypothetical protein BRARA_B02293 [Brassica rapa]CAF2140654.1 unnamed protein product [Brassica napus]CDY26838.1 BnaA02g18630D [Brassica napus]
MGKIKKVNPRAHITAPYPLPPSCCKKQWSGTKCSVCLESPHNAVLLLCSSYHKGCRPYMCATSTRFANCLDQYRKSHGSEQLPLLCPLCRGQVKGWTVVEEARAHFNSKRRTCMQENCSFKGNFKKLKKHMTEKHPHACPRAIDPALETQWKRLERERDRRDVISTIMSSTPGAVVLGDYVIEPRRGGVYDGEDEEDYSSDDSLSNNGVLDLDSWQGQNRHIRFIDMESSDFASSSRSPAPPSRSGFLVHRNQRGGNRGR